MSVKPPEGVHVWLVLLKASHALRKLAYRNIGECGLSLSDFQVLEVLLHKGALPVNVIGPKVRLTPGSISVAIDRLFERGLVSRIEDTTDRRIRIVDLTPKGRAIIEPVFVKHAELFDMVMSVITDEERTQLESLLKKVGRHAELLHQEMTK